MEGLDLLIVSYPPQVYYRSPQGIRHISPDTNGEEAYVLALGWDGFIVSTPVGRCVHWGQEGTLFFGPAGEELFYSRASEYISEVMRFTCAQAEYRNEVYGMPSNDALKHWWDQTSLVLESRIPLSELERMVPHGDRVEEKEEGKFVIQRVDPRREGIHVWGREPS